MQSFRKKVYAAAGYNTVFFGPGRSDFDPTKPMRPYEEYLQETAKGTLDQLQNKEIDEGVLGSFMPARFLKQAHLPAFLPFMVPSLLGKPCIGVEGACGTGGRAVATAVRSVLSDLADTVFVSGFEMQNTMKSVYGADVLAGAGYYSKERKNGLAHYFPGVFAERAGAYYQQFGEGDARKAMAKWYEHAILSARKNPKAQEFENTSKDLYQLGLTKPNPEKFIPYLNYFDCSKVSDGASSIIIASEEGLKKLGIPLSEAIEIIGMGDAEGDITQSPKELTIMDTTQIAAKKALEQSKVNLDQIALLEVHDCFTISGMLSLEAIGFAGHGKAPAFILDGGLSKVQVNLSGGLGGFGHPTGATGVRQMVDMLHQFTGKAANPGQLKTPYGMTVNMGGNDKTVTSFVVKGLR